MNRNIIFSDIDGIIWPEVPTLFSIASNIYPKRKKLKVNMLNTYTVKSEQNIPPLLSQQEVKNIFKQYESLRIFREPLENLNKHLQKHFKKKFNIDTSDFKSNIEFLKENKENLTFFTSRKNYQKDKLFKDTKNFLKFYNLNNDLFFKNKDKNKGDIITAKIGKRSYDRINIIEDNLLHMLRIFKALKEEEINNFRFIIINSPWNMTKYMKKRYNKADNIQKVKKALKKLKKAKRIIRVNRLVELENLR